MNNAISNILLFMLRHSVSSESLTDTAEQINYWKFLKPLGIRYMRFHVSDRHRFLVTWQMPDEQTPLFESRMSSLYPNCSAKPADNHHSEIFKSSRINWPWKSWPVPLYAQTTHTWRCWGLWTILGNGKFPLSKISN